VGWETHGEGASRLDCNNDLTRTPVRLKLLNRPSRLKKA
jgi:hypothetical protein